MLRKAIVVLLSAVLSTFAVAGELHVAAAADLVYCLEDIDAAFKQQNPDADIKVSTGSSGDFFAQIQHGAPYDVFLSADTSYPKKLAETGFANEKTMFRYAVGHLAIWTLDAKIDLSKGLSSVAQAQVNHLAIANPAHAPYGRAAQAALQQAHLWDAIQPKLVMGENIAQTAQFVQSGNADVGIVAYSLLKSPKLQGVGHFVLVPIDQFPTMEQAAIITQHGADNPLSARYMAFLASPTARAIFDRYGFSLPEASK
jgi:molybdate transport system substrate-binding protein